MVENKAAGGTAQYVAAVGQRVVRLAAGLCRLVLCRSSYRNVLERLFCFRNHAIAYGIIFVLISFHEPKVTIERLDGIDSKTALSIGLFQCLALVPGTSRSGASILGGMYLGCSRAVASRFSFLIAVPVMVLAGLADGFAYFHNGNTLSFLQGILLTLGVVVTFVVSVVTIKWFCAGSKTIRSRFWMVSDLFGHRDFNGILFVGLLGRPRVFFSTRKKPAIKPAGFVFLKTGTDSCSFPEAVWIRSPFGTLFAS